MVNRDYTKEIGLKSATRTVPLPVALTIIAVVGVLVWVGVVRLQGGASHALGAGGTDAAPKAAVTDDAQR